MGLEVDREMTYQWMLRALGAYLDGEPSCRITLLEMPDGFVVRLQRHLHQLDPRLLHFKRETVKQQIDALMQSKPRGVPPRHGGLWAGFPNGHQDFFRALGYELDESAACDVLIDELEDGILVMYTHQEPDADSARRRMVVLGPKEIEEILNAAFERRRKGATAPA